MIVVYRVNDASVLFVAKGLGEVPGKYLERHEADDPEDNLLLLDTAAHTCPQMAAKGCQGCLAEHYLLEHISAKIVDLERKANYAYSSVGAMENGGEY